MFMDMAPISQQSSLVSLSLYGGERVIIISWIPFSDLSKVFSMYVQRGVMYGPLTYIPYSSHIASRPFTKKASILLELFAAAVATEEAECCRRFHSVKNDWCARLMIFFSSFSVCVCVKRTGQIENQTKTFRRRRCRHHHHHHHADEDESSGVTFVYSRRWCWETETTHQKPLRKTRRIDEWPFSLLCHPFVLF